MIPGDIAWAVEEQKEFDVATFSLPERLGQVKDSFKGTSGKAVVHIQDAHCNYFAQHKIAEIVGYLRDEYGIDTINLEGGVQAYDLSPFTGIYDAAIRSSVADRYVREGLLSGAELFAANNPGTVTLWGMEDAKLYLDNLGVYRGSLAYQDAVVRDLGALSRLLSELKRHIYSPELLLFDLKYAQYKSGNLSFKEYFSYLVSTANQRTVGTGDLTAIRLLEETLRQEALIDFKKADLQKDELIARLQKKLSRKEWESLAEKIVEFKTEMITPAAFYAHVAALAAANSVSLTDLPDLTRYVAYQSLYGKIDKSRIMDEIARLETRITEGLYRNDRQRELARLSKNVILEKNLFTVALTKEDYEYYTKNEGSFAVKEYLRFIRREAPAFKIPVPAEDAFPDLDSRREHMAAFYKDSFARDDAFMRNARFDAAPAVIMVTGGFHAPNLCALLKEKNVSYVSIAPSFKSEDGYQCPYFAVLAGKEGPFLASLDSSLNAMQVPSLFNALGGMADQRASELARIGVMALAYAREREAEAGAAAARGFAIRATDGYITMERSAGGEYVFVFRSDAPAAAFDIVNQDAPVDRRDTKQVLWALAQVGHDAAVRDQKNHRYLAAGDPAIGLARSFIARIGDEDIRRALTEQLDHLLSTSRTVEGADGAAVTKPSLVSVVTGLRGARAGGQGIYLPDHADIADADARQRAIAGDLVHELLGGIYGNSPEAHTIIAQVVERAVNGTGEGTGLLYARLAGFAFTAPIWNERWSPADRMNMDRDFAEEDMRGRPLTARGDYRIAKIGQGKIALSTKLAVLPIKDLSVTAYITHDRLVNSLEILEDLGEVQGRYKDVWHAFLAGLEHSPPLTLYGFGDNDYMSDRMAGDGAAAIHGSYINDLGMRIVLGVGAYLIEQQRLRLWTEGSGDNIKLVGEVALAGNKRERFEVKLEKFALISAQNRPGDLLQALRMAVLDSLETGQGIEDALSQPSYGRQTKRVVTILPAKEAHVEIQKASNDVSLDLMDVLNRMSTDELCGLLQRICPKAAGITPDDLIGEAHVEYYAEGAHKYVFRVTFPTKSGRPITVLAAVKSEKGEGDITDEELRYTRELGEKLRKMKEEGHDLGRVPAFGEVFTLSDGRRIYLEEFIDGQTVTDKVKAQAFTYQQRVSVMKLVVAMSLLMGGVLPLDLHGGNFMIENGTDEAVMIDAGEQRAELGQVILIDLYRYGYYEDGAAEDANVGLYDAVLETHTLMGKEADGVALLQSKLLTLDIVLGMLDARERQRPPGERVTQGDELRFNNVTRKKLERVRRDLAAYLGRKNLMPEAGMQVALTTVGDRYQAKLQAKLLALSRSTIAADGSGDQAGMHEGLRGILDSLAHPQTGQEKALDPVRAISAVVDSIDILIATAEHNRDAETVQRVKMVRASFEGLLAANAVMATRPGSFNVVVQFFPKRDGMNLALGLGRDGDRVVEKDYGIGAKSIVGCAEGITEDELVGMVRRVFDLLRDAEGRGIKDPLVFMYVPDFLWAKIEQAVRTSQSFSPDERKRFFASENRSIVRQRTDLGQEDYPNIMPQFVLGTKFLDHYRQRSEGESPPQELLNLVSGLAYGNPETIIKNMLKGGNALLKLRKVDYNSISEWARAQRAVLTAL